MIKILFFCAIALFFHAPLFAQTCKNQSHPGRSIIEINPLLLINQGLGILGEYGVYKHSSLGIDLQANVQTPYDRNFVKATRVIYAAAPKVRYYFNKNCLAGLFLGVKVFFSNSQLQIADSNTSSSVTINNAAPTVQLGYRFLAQNGFTMSAFLGAGFKFANDQFANSQIPPSQIGNADWTNAQSALNKNVSQFQPDYGITIGYLF